MPTPTDTRTSDVEEVVNAVKRKWLGTPCRGVIEHELEWLDATITEALTSFRESIEANKYPDTFTFDVTYYPDGWKAQCREVDGILTGGDGIDITEEFIMAMIEDAILTAMGKKIVLHIIPKSTTEI